MTELRGHILAVLREAGDRFVSGEELSRRFGISRTAVWKHIQYLQAAGYPIEAVRNRGYRLALVEQPLSVDAIQAGLTTARLGRKMVVLETVDSTNRRAFSEAEQGAPEGYTVLAELQTSGKGRRGRSWHSPPGVGIWMSLILRPTLPLVQAPQLTLMAAVSVAEAVREVTGIPLGIKWPNDLLLPDGRKVCGILTEMSAEAEQIHFIVLGIGLNVSHREADFPEDLRSVAGSLAMLMDGKAPSRIALVQSILGHLEEDYDLFCRSGGFAALRSRWEAYNVTIGRKIAVQTVRGRITGWARRIDDEGALWIDDGTGREEKIISAEVMFESV